VKDGKGQAAIKFKFQIPNYRSMNWPEIETSTHQDHVIKHVLGATVLGWFTAGEAAHMLLDIGFLWTIYLDAEMNLLPQGVAIGELEGNDITSADRTELAFDADQLLQQGRDTPGLKRFTAAPVEYLIDSVEVFGSDGQRLVVINGESGTIKIETSIENAEIGITAADNQ
jgi:hypothetical protein